VKNSSGSMLEDQRDLARDRRTRLNTEGGAHGGAEKKKSQGRRGDVKGDQESANAGSEVRKRIGTRD